MDGVSFLFLGAILLGISLRVTGQLRWGPFWKSEKRFWRSIDDVTRLRWSVASALNLYHAVTAAGHGPEKRVQELLSAADYYSFLGKLAWLGRM